jgi:hypothetical protein
MAIITVVTIWYNNLADLQKSCASVDEQTNAPFCHLIINGSTNNDIANWLSETQQAVYRQWINEPDNGIADAFNKGVQHAPEGFIHLLNSGDIYADKNVFSQINNFLNAHPNISWISGKIILKRAQHWVAVGKPFDAKKLYKGMRSIAHPTWFVKKEVYERCGYFNMQYKIGMDYDLLCKIKDAPYAFYNAPVRKFDDTGISSIQYLASLKENIVIYESHFGFSLKCRLWQWRLKMLYLLLQTRVGKFLFLVKKKLGLENH